MQGQPDATGRRKISTAWRAISKAFPLVIISLSLQCFAQPSAAAELASAVIRGSTVFTPAELFATYRDHLGKPITRASARDIVLRVAALYRDAGYVQPQIRVDDALLAVGVL